MTSSPAPVDRLLDLLESDLDAVNARIREHMQSEVRLIPQLADYLIGSGGKRLRPLLTLASARLLGEQGAHPVALATAVEFIHTATLLHDDVVDGSDLRRGQQVANQVYGNKPAILVGDFLFSRAFQLMVEVQSLPVLACLSNASAVIAEGEVAQLQTANNLATDEAAYRHVVGAKTAALFAAACEVSGLLAQASAEQVAALRAYGQHLGVAFQIADDALDYDAARARLGKQVGDDFRDGKVTLPAILAYAEGSTEERAFWDRTLGLQRQSEEDLAQAQAYLAKHGALERSLAAAEAESRLAVQALAGFEAEPLREALEGLAWQAARRQH